MTQLAKYIYSEETNTLQSNISNSTFQVSFRHSDLFNQVTPLFYGNRVRLTIQVSDNLVQVYALIKGMFEFHRTNKFQFRYDKADRTIETDITIDRLEELQDFLGELDLLIRKEIEFKAVLKKVIFFEREFKSLADSLYGGLMTSAK